MGFLDQLLQNAAKVVNQPGQALYKAGQGFRNAPAINQATGYANKNQYSTDPATREGQLFSGSLQAALGLGNNNIVAKTALGVPQGIVTGAVSLGKQFQNKKGNNYTQINNPLLQQALDTKQIGDFQGEGQHFVNDIPSQLGGLKSVLDNDTAKNILGAAGAVLNLAPVNAKEAELVNKAVVGTGKLAVKGAKAGAQAVDTAALALHDKGIDKIAQSYGENVGQSHNLFDDSLAKSASPDDIKGAQKYLNQLSKGKDIGPVSTTTNEHGAVEPVTKDGLQKYLAYKQANENVFRNTPQTNDYGGSNFTNNPFSHVPTNHIEGNVLKQVMDAKQAASEGGYIQLPGAKNVPSNPDVALSNFPNRLMEEDRTEPIQQALLQNSTHEVLHNNDTLARTANTISKNEDQALSLAKNGESADANATAMQLLDKYLAEGSYDKATDLTNAVLPRFTRQGQSIQILSRWGKLTPTGAVKYAARQVEKNSAKGLVGNTLEDTLSTTHGSVKETAKDIANQLHDEIKAGKISTLKLSDTKKAMTPAEMLAKRINASSDKKINEPDPVKDMVNTLHKVAKQVLPETEKKNIPNNAMDLIGKAIKDKENYKDVYNQAKEIVKDKYKNNPEALVELDKYFGTEAERTYSKSQLNTGIKAGLKGVDLGKLVKQHYLKVDETGKNLEDKLIEQAGLSKEQASQLAGDIQKRYGDLVQERKDSLIKQIFGEKPKPEQVAAIERILTLNNIGALGKDELRPLVAKKLGIKELSSDDTQKISEMANHIQTLEEGSIERNKAIAKMMDYIHGLSPSSVGKQLIETWRSLLLTGIPTHAGNFFGNGAEALFKHGLVNPVATLFDIPTSLVTKKASRSFTLPTSYAKGAGMGIKNGAKYLKTGFDEADASAKYEAQGTVFSKNKVGQAAGAVSGGIYRVLGAEDQPFRYASRQHALDEIAKVAGMNQGLRGKELAQFRKDKVANPDTDMLEQATAEGENSVFGNDTLLNQIASKLKQPITIKGKEVYNGAIGDFVIPFSKVPAAVATRILERSPLGYASAAKDIVQGLRHKGFDQRAFTGKLANATVGTGVALTVGGGLQAAGLISLGYPSKDPKEQARWKAEGKQAYSIKIGNQWLSLNYVQPFGSMLAYGAAYKQARDSGQSVLNSSAAAAGEAAKAVTGQSFLQGLSGALNAVQQPEQSAAKYIQSAASSAVPGIIRKSAAATDTVQRQVNSVVDGIKSGIPGARETLLPQVDAYGHEVQRPASGADTFINPLKPSNDTSNAVTKEVDRLHNTDPTNSKMDVQPVPVDRNISVEGQKIQLTPEQQTNLQKAVGQATYKSWDNLIKTPQYQALSNADKIKALTKASDGASDIAERTYISSNGLHQYAKGPSKSVRGLADGSIDPTTFATTFKNTSSNTAKTTKATTTKKKSSTKKVASSSTRSSSTSTKSRIASYSKQASLASRGSQITSTAKLASIAKSAKLSSNRVSFQNKVKKTGLKAFSKGNTQKVRTA